MNATAADASALRKLSSFSIIPEITVEFLSTAHTGTAVDVCGEIYKRLPGGLWIRVENSIQDEGSTAEELAAKAVAADKRVRLLQAI